MPEGTLLSGRYRLEGLLGQGGMAYVWRARDEFLGRVVAVKEMRLPPGLSAAQRARICERMLREARAAAGLTHPSIITVHDVLEHDERPWIVMDLISGPSLEQVRMDEGPLPPRRVAEIGVQLLDALALAHHRGILHRDVKPSNVLLSGPRLAILTDFGIATNSADQSMTSPNALIGSPGYMAPERLKAGEPVGPPSDLWALGATLYAAVEGKPPFYRENVLAMIGAALTDPAPAPEHAGPLGPLLMALLAYNPAHRPGPAEIRRFLEAVATDSAPARGLGIPQPPPPPLLGAGATAATLPPMPLPGLRRRGRSLALAGAAIAGGALLLGGGSFLLFWPGSKAAPAAVTSSTPPISTSASPSATAGPPDPCSLLTADQGKEFGDTGAASAQGTDTCSWGQNLQIKVQYLTAQQGKSAVKVATDAFALAKSQAASQQGTGGDPVAGTNTSAVRDVPKIGDGAFAQDTDMQDKTGSSSSMFTSARSTVWVRVGPVILTVEYKTDGQSAITATMKNNAIKAAQYAAQSLAGRHYAQS